MQQDTCHSAYNITCGMETCTVDGTHRYNNLSCFYKRKGLMKMALQVRQRCSFESVPVD
jgi:hypothetical protein